MRAKIKENRVRMKRTNEQYSRGMRFSRPTLTNIMCALTSEGPSQHVHRSVVRLKIS